MIAGTYPLLVWICYILWFVLFMQRLITMKSNVPHLYDLYLVLWCLPRLENEEAVSTLKESTKVLTQHLEEVGTAAFGSAWCPLTSCLTTRILLLFPSHLLKTLPQLVDSLPFASDERSRSFHQVYRGTFPAVQPSSWCILFRCTAVHLTMLIHTFCPPTEKSSTCPKIRFWSPICSAL